MPLYAYLIAAVPLLLLAVGLIPTGWANRHAEAMANLSQAVTSFVLALIFVSILLLIEHGPISGSSSIGPEVFPLRLSLYWDNLAALMASLIGVVGWTIARFSVRYLHGEANQGRFLKWMLFTLGSVLLLVVVGNLAWFLVAWALTSWGLNHLLVHYPDRAWAIWTARKKFLISRLGDLFLLGAIWLTYREFGSLEYVDLFAAAKAQAVAGQVTWSEYGIAILLVLGSMTKSAQFPFHSWLPDTLETPTPVSALMHAGIINAGGFLVIRLSPLISLSPTALGMLALIGTLTAVLGGVMMLTQASVKRYLAYSTMAQMGFMMLQCGLGNFSAAMLHIIAHSLYKAHAFLRSGSVLEEASFSKGEGLSPSEEMPKVSTLAGSLAISALIGVVVSWALGVELTSKPGGFPLFVILILALTSLVARGLRTGTPRLAVPVLMAATGVALLYFAGYRVIDGLMAPSVIQYTPQFGVLQIVCACVVLMCFGFLFLLQWILPTTADRPVLQAIYVHAANGFYFDIPARRLTARLFGRVDPVP